MKSIVSVMLAMVLSFTFCATSAIARPSVDDEVKSAENKGNTAHPNEKLRTDMLNLIADAKAGKVVPASRSQMEPQKSNNLSKGAKIAIGVGIAVAVIAIIVVVKADKGPTEGFRIF
jgi:CBS domain containing-hemolysin-like protein